MLLFIGLPFQLDSILILLLVCMICFQNSVNSRYQTIVYPWLVFGEKVKVNTVFIRDSTGVSDSILILFGGALQKGVLVKYLVFNSALFCVDVMGGTEIQASTNFRLGI